MNRHTNKYVKTLVAFLLTLLGGTGKAFADTKLYVSDFSIAAGETKEIAVNLDTDESDITLIEGTINLPTGLSFKEATGNRITSRIESTRSSGFSIESESATGKFMFNTWGNGSLNAGTGAIFYVTVVASNPIGFATGQITITKASARKDDKSAVTVSTPSATVTNNGGTGSGVTLSLSENNITMNPGDKKDIDVLLSNEGVTVDGLQATIDLPEGWTATITTSERLTGNEGSDTHFLCSTGISGTSGAIFTIHLTAPAEFTEIATITLKEITATIAFVSTTFADLVLTVNPPNPMDESITQLKTDVAELQAKLDKAKTDYPAIDFSELQGRITTVSTTLDNGGDIDAEKIQKEINDISTAIDEKIHEAILEATKTSLKGKITTLEEDFSQLNDYINTLKLGSTFEAELSELGESIEDISAELQKQYEAKSIDEAAIQELIDEAAEKIKKLRAKAEAKAAAAAVTMTLSKASISMAAGATADIEVSMDNTEVTVTDFSATIELPDGWSAETKENKDRMINVGSNKVIKSWNIIGESGTLFTITLMAPPVFTESATITLKDITAKVNGKDASLPNLTLTVEAVESGSSGVTWSFAESEITAQPNTTVSVAVNMKNEGVKIEAFSTILELPTGWTYTADKGERVEYLSVGEKIMSFSSAVSGTEGAIFTLNLSIPDGFKGQETVRLTNINVTANGVNEKLDDIELTVTFKDTKTYEALKAEIAALKEKLDNAETTIKDECPDVDSSSTIASIRKSIETLDKNLDKDYNDNKAIDKEKFEAEIQNIDKSIDDLVAKAKDDQLKMTRDKLQKDIDTAQQELDVLKAYIEGKGMTDTYGTQLNKLQGTIDLISKELAAAVEAKHIDESAIQKDIDEVRKDIAALKAEAEKNIDTTYEKLKQEIANLKAKLDYAMATLQSECPDVESSTYSSTYNQLISRINSLGTLLDAYNGDSQITNEEKAEIEKEVSAISTAIDQLIADVKAEQQKMGELLTLYNKVKAKINDVQAELDAVNTYVKTYCKDKDYTSEISALQTRINTVSSDLETAKAKGSISEADFTTTLTTLSSDIAKLKAKAAAEQSSSQSIPAELTALYQTWSQKIAAVQEKLKAAVEQIRDTYPASTVEAMEAEISAVQEKLATVSSQLDDLYYTQKLTASTTFDLASIEKAIDALTASAKTKNDAINTSTYNTLKAEIDALQKQLDDTKADIKKNCDDTITATAETDAKAIQTQIDQLKANLDALNKAGKLGADSKLDATATKAVTDAIGDMYFKAIKTQNDKAYPVLVKEIEALGDSLSAARKQIEEAYGEEIATAMAETLDAIQKKIDEAKAALDKQHANILITKNTTVDKETILAAITKAKADAKAKATPDDPDKPDDPDNPDNPQPSKEAQALYKALTADLAALQRQLDNAKAEMERKYDKDIVEAGKEQFDALQKMIDEMKAKIEELYKTDKLDKNMEIDKDEFAAALGKAKDATKALQAEKNYKAMTEEIAKLEAELAKAKEEVEKNAADVAEEYDLQFALIEQLLAKLKDQVEKEQKEGMVSMNNMASADIIRNSLSNVTKDAAKREEAFQANKKLTEKLDEVESLLDTTMEQIRKDYANVAGDFADDMAKIQAMIDALRAELRQKYLDGELNANSSIDTTAIRNAITALLKAAKDAHTVGIFGITMPEGATTEMYDLNGQRISQPKKGTVVIVRMQDGKLRKMVVR